MIERTSLSRTVGNSVLGAATLPLRLVLWVLHGLLWLAIPAFLVTAVLHHGAGDAGGSVRDVIFLLVSAVALGVVRFARTSIGR